MLLRDSPFKADATWADAVKLARDAPRRRSATATAPSSSGWWTWPPRSIGSGRRPRTLSSAIGRGRTTANCGLDANRGRWELAVAVGVTRIDVGVTRQSEMRGTGSAQLPLHGGRRPRGCSRGWCSSHARSPRTCVPEYGRDGDAAPAVRSVLVPGVRVRARVRLALERRDDHGHGGAEGRAPRARARPRHLRRRRQGRGLAADARRDRAATARRCRSIRVRSSTPAGCRRRWTAPPSRTATSSITTRSSSRPPAAGASSSRA